MDRTFGEVRVAYEVWARAQASPPAPDLPQAAYDVARDAALSAAAQARREARAWAAGALDDATFEHRLAALLVHLAAAAWWQGAAAQQDSDPR